MKRAFGLSLLLLFAGQALAACPMFPADNVWNTPIAQLPVDTRSNAYVASIGDTAGLHPDFGSGTWDGGPIGIPYNIVSGSPPKGVVSPNPIKFCQFKSSPATILSRSIIGLALRNV